MTPVMQTKFGNPDGNCMAACIASIWEIPIEEAPTLEEDVKAGRSWWWALRQWCSVRGFTPVMIYQTTGHGAMLEAAMSMAGGDSPRGTEGGHSVVWQRGKLVHDPHPDGTGLERNPEWFVLFVPIVPEACR